MYTDESGPEIARLLRAMSAEPDWPLTCLHHTEEEGSGSGTGTGSQSTEGPTAILSAIVPDDAGI